VTPAETATLQYLVAHPGQPIATIAKEMHLSTGKVVSRLGALKRMGLILLPGDRGLDRVPLVTAEGVQRAAKPVQTRQGCLTAITTPLAVSEAGMAILRALLVNGAMSLRELSRRLGKGWGKCAAVGDEVHALSASGFVVHDRLVALTEKGQRAATGDLHAVPPMQIPRTEPATRVAMGAPKRDIDSLVPAALRTLGGIRHPPIPRAAERPSSIRLRDWMRHTTPDHSPLHDACARGMA
jgi:DNA-binding Lrp family transcriptional regulator